ncbi:twin-arginine translocase TatA/TatE family subunit [Falsirhodobacter halotolerans]|uniref:twin-arginine translocase TatA/TatE family subunit n=1 Tax=Falsirhodobacter halotolerans TaxID=1146892 RepID=UPI001FD1A8A9|nr:twin-arginine translocase TatA/TatE family subunit [Falsirhodobacter halotolerans]MCJ8139534.1 twin-arginine translocase TatA/TatE family subunit [Falsirhodobacter halotolerans]
MSGAFSLSHILVVAVVALVIFGQGKVAGMMGEIGRGFSAFKRGIAEGEADTTAAPPVSKDPEIR